MVSCNETDKEVVISVDKTSIPANGKSEAVFTVTYGGEDVTASSTITCGGDEISGNKFISETTGEYKFKAGYNGNISKNEVTVSVIAGLMLTVDKAEIYADDIDEAEFTVMLDGKDVTGRCSVCSYTSGVCLTGSIFTSEIVGEQEFYATYLSNPEIGPSNSVTVTVKELPGRLVLSADKNRFLADGQQSAAFTVSYEGTNVTADAAFHTTDGTPLQGNVLSTTVGNQYEVYAVYTVGNEELESNHVTVSAVLLNDIGFDTERKLHKNVSFFTQTGTWCAPCYTLKVNMKLLNEKFGDHLVFANLYTASGDKSIISNPIADRIKEQMREDPMLRVFVGYPSTYPDFRTVMAGGSAESYLTDHYNQCITKPAMTAFRINSSYANNVVTASVTVAAQEAAGYTIGILLVEDNIICPQYTPTGRFVEDYNHTDVLREMGTENIFGDDLRLLAGEITTKEFTIPVGTDPDGKAYSFKPENLSVIVYTLYQIPYETGMTHVMANSVKSKVGSSTDFKYAE
jgi:thiol-disulfide isomerase/thioredoxin